MRKIGDRVIAISGERDGVVYWFGEGMYAGEFQVSEDAGGFNFGQVGPRIDLDNGESVFGCECWWGKKEKFLPDGVIPDTWRLITVKAARAQQEGL